MEEKNGLDLLLDSLSELGLSPSVTVEDKGTHFSSLNRFASCTTVTVVLSDSLYFLARSNVNSAFTGIYSSVNLPIEAEFKVYVRNWFDSLFYSNRQKVGIKFIDENLTIVSQQFIPFKELTIENAKLFLDINKAGNPYNLILENNYLASIIEPLKEKKIIGIETNDWLYKKEDLENLLKYGEVLIRNIKNTSVTEHTYL